MAVNAESEYERTQALYERNNASEGEFEAAIASLESAQAQVKAAESQVAAAKQQLSYTRLSSPMEALVVDIPVEVGETVRTGQPIATLMAGEYPEAVVDVSELLITEIRPGMRSVVRFDAVRDHTFGGKVTEVTVLPSKGLTTYPVTIQLDKTWREYLGPQPIRPGMTVEAEFRFSAPGDERPRHVVPAPSVLQDRTGRYVFLAKPKGGDRAVVERRDVEIGDLVADGLEIFNGLKDGDLVIIAGVHQIKDGQEVRVLPQSKD